MLLGVVQLCNRYYNHMTYEELKIQLDLNEPINILRFIGRKTKDNDWFVVCDDGDCHLFDHSGDEIDVKKIKSLNGWLIPKDIKKIIVLDSVKSIGYCAFARCKNLTSINIPNSVKSIGYYAFAFCENLTLINIPDLVESIEDWAFEWCENLTSIVIPDSVEHIGYYAFYKCKNLKSLIFKGKTINHMKSMKCYPFGIEDKLIIKCID